MKARFIRSALTDFPNLKDPHGNPLPEVALVGRSNVGKSSLINHLFNQKGLAKTSATPGKTRLLNFFLIEERFIFVDLPGYGFAKAPLEEIEKWSSAIQTYFDERKEIKLLLLLIDCRKSFTPEDLLILKWADEKKVPVLSVFTKTDKLSISEKRALLEKYPDAHFHSIKDPQLCPLLQKRIEALLWG